VTRLFTLTMILAVAVFVDWQLAMLLGGWQRG
jgi:hypothetical protein